MSTRSLCLLAVLALASGCECSAPPLEDAGVDASAESDAGQSEACERATDCDDGAFCNGVETCAPGDVAADARGCVAGSRPCTDAEVCEEDTDTCALDSCDMPDEDRDGFNRITCGGDDCDDDDVTRFASNVEVCDDGHDEDCDPTTLGDVDLDGDGFISAACCNGATCGGDCNDLRRDVHPGATEVCNAIDDDCDGVVDGVGAFCPVGTCIDRRCTAIGWERVWGGASFTRVRGLALDETGNTFLLLSLLGAADIDGDGTPESAGRYVTSIAPDGRHRWTVAAAGDLSGDLGSQLSASPSADETLLMRSDGYERIANADGQSLGIVAVAPPAGWSALQVMDLASARSSVFLAATLEGNDGRAAYVARLALDGTVQAERLFAFDATTPIRRIAASDAGVVIEARSSGPVALEAGQDPVDGQFVARLTHELVAEWGVSGIPANNVAISDDGDVAVVGAVLFDYMPFWGDPTIEPQNPGDEPNDSAALLVMLTPDGGYRWHRVHDGPDDDLFIGAEFDARGAIMMAGYFTGEFDAGPRFGRFAANETDAVFGAFDVDDGFVLGARHLSGAGFDTAVLSAVDRFANLVVVGQYSQNITLPTGTTYPEAAPATPGFDAFALRVADLF